MLDDGVDNFAQVFKRRVRIRVWLQVGEDSGVWVLLAELRNELFELFANRNFCLVKDGAKAAVVAVAASRKSLGSIEVRAAHAAIEREFAHLEVVREEFQK